MLGSLQTQSRGCALLSAAQAEGKGKGKRGKERKRTKGKGERKGEKKSFHEKTQQPSNGQVRRGHELLPASSDISSQEVFLVSDEY